MAKKGSRFTPYSPEFKLQVVEDYLSGQSGGMPSIVKKYGLKSDSEVRNWTKKYRENPHLLHQELSNGKPEYKRFDPELAQLITRIFKKTLKGYRFICYQLRRYYQLFSNPKTIFRYMRILGLRSPIRQKRYQSCTQREINEKARHVHYKVLARNVKAERPLLS